MDHRVERLRTPKECENFAKNATNLKRPDLALEAQRKAVELLVSEHSASTPVEAEALAAVYAHEALLTRKKGKKTRASWTWQVAKRHGIVEAVERTVNRTPVQTGYETLREMGLEDLAFEAIVLRHEESFSSEAVATAKARLAEWSQI